MGNTGAHDSIRVLYVQVKLEPLYNNVMVNVSPPELFREFERSLREVYTAKSLTSL